VTARLDGAGAVAAADEGTALPAAVATPAVVVGPEPSDALDVAGPVVVVGAAGRVVVGTGAVVVVETADIVTRTTLNPPWPSPVTPPGLS
jgi:hypothetical protein